MKITNLVDALRYIAGRKCACAKIGKEPPPCSHSVAKDALVEYDKIVALRDKRRGRFRR